MLEERYPGIVEPLSYRLECHWLALTIFVKGDLAVLIILRILFFIIFYIDQLGRREADAHADGISRIKLFPLSLAFPFGQEIPFRTKL